MPDLVKPTKKSSADSVDDFDESDDLDESSSGSGYEIPPHKRMSQHWKKFIKDSGPYYFTFTLTFAVLASFESCCKFVNKFIHRFNLSYFKERYYKRSDWLEGFVFFEKHFLHNSINEWHVHMRIKPNARYCDFNLAQHTEKFQKAAAKVFDHKKRHVFRNEHIDIQYAYEGGIGGYLFKQLNDSCLFRLKMIGVKGLSDLESHEYHRY